MMSTRTAVWLVFVGVLVAAMVAFLVVREYVLARRSATNEDALARTAGGEPAQVQQAGEQANRTIQAAIADDGTAWPMFHANPSLTGEVPWTLDEPLVRIWRFKTGSEVKSSAAISVGRVFIGSSDANVYALDLRTGAKLWAYTTKGAVEAPPAVVEGRVFVGSADGSLYALDAADGSLKWAYKTGAEIHGAANWTRSPNGQAVWILVGSYDSNVYCIDSHSGGRIWTYETGSYVNGSPAVADGLCAFGGCDAKVHVVSLAGGERRSEIDTGSYVAASAALAQGEAYVGNYDHVFLRADLGSGRIVWKYTDSNAPFFSSAALAADIVVVGGRDGFVHAIGRDDGKRRWAFKTLGDVDSSPAVCGDKVLVGSSDGRLYLLRLSDGRELWSYELGRPVVSSPAVAQGVAVVGCDDGYVYAFASKKAVGGGSP